LFSTILLVSPDPIYVLDLEGRFVYVNKATADLYGLPQKSILGKNAHDLNFPFADSFQEHLQLVIDSKNTYRGELAHQFSPGHGNWFEYLLAPVLQDKDSVEVIVGISRDITERKIAEETIWHNANYDLLTDLPNRRLFLDRLDQEVKHALRSDLPCAVFFIDLDGFKQVNDSLGHEAGDRLLCLVAERLNTCVREADTVARMGGDEFTVILTGLNDINDVSAVAKKILDSLASPFDVLGQEIRIAGSMEISLLASDASTSDELLRNADHAMYVAKNAGRNQFSFFQKELIAADAG
jgi:diguanylate cyclase (GGDEF)-like protein/PAS domain S-box-containing protein